MVEPEPPDAGSERVRHPRAVSMVQLYEPRGDGDHSFSTFHVKQLMTISRDGMFPRVAAGHSDAGQFSPSAPRPSPTGRCGVKLCA